MSSTSYDPEQRAGRNYQIAGYIMIGLAFVSGVFAMVALTQNQSVVGGVAGAIGVAVSLVLVRHCFHLSENALSNEKKMSLRNGNKPKANGEEQPFTLGRKLIWAIVTILLALVAGLEINNDSPWPLLKRAAEHGRAWLPFGGEEEDPAAGGTPSPTTVPSADATPVAGPPILGTPILGTPGAATPGAATPVAGTPPSDESSTMKRFQRQHHQSRPTRVGA